MSTDQKEITVNLLQANLYSLPILVLIIGIMTSSYLIVWDKKVFLEGFGGFRFLYTYLFLIIGFFLHEIIHLFSYHFLGKIALENIRIGFQIKSLTPYAYCSKSMSINAYRWSAVLPGLILGIIPGIFFLISGNSYSFILAMILTIAAGGDFLLIWLLRKIPAKSLVQDHPEKAGCIILEGNK